MFQTISYLGRIKPAVLTSEVIHGGIKVVQIPVSEDLVIDNVPLSARVMERVSIAFSREIKPLIGGQHRFGCLFKGHTSG